MESYILTLRKMFEENRNEQNAFHMEKYMKNHFKFFGIKSQKRREIEKQFFS